MTRRRFRVALPLFVLALAALLYLPFAAAGTGVVGFLPRYLEEQGLSSGDGVFWLALLGKAGLLRPTTSAVFAGSVGAATVGLALWTRRRSANDISSQLRGTTFLLVAFFLLITPTFPWYFLAALLIAPLIGVRSPFALATSGFLLYGFHADAPSFFGRWALLMGFAIVAAVGDLTRTDKKGGGP